MPEYRLARARFRRIRRMPLVSPRGWLRRFVFWVGAVAVAVMAIGFARLADIASGLFLSVQAPRPWVAFLICPAGLAISFLLTRHVFPGAQGSGIPQVIAAQHMTDRAAIGRVLSPRIAVGKVALTLLGLCCGASIGREGPTVQVGASIMHSLGQATAAAAPGAGARAGAGWGCRGGRGGVQHAVGRRGVRDRGTQPLVRGPHLRHGADRGDHRRHHHRSP